MYCHVRSVGAELEVQLGARHEEVVVVANGGGKDIDRRSAWRGEGANEAVAEVIVVRIEVEPQAFEAEGRGSRSRCASRVRPP